MMADNKYWRAQLMHKKIHSNKKTITFKSATKYLKQLLDAGINYNMWQLQSLREYW
jgi:hypothetical protein